MQPSCLITTQKSLVGHVVGKFSERFKSKSPNAHLVCNLHARVHLLFNWLRWTKKRLRTLLARMYVLITVQYALRKALQKIKFLGNKEQRWVHWSQALLKIEISSKNLNFFGLFVFRFALFNPSTLFYQNQTKSVSDCEVTIQTSNQTPHYNTSCPTNWNQNPLEKLQDENTLDFFIILCQICAT